jgi:hypothetical protein
VVVVSDTVLNAASVMASEVEKSARRPPATTTVAATTMKA